MAGKDKVVFRAVSGDEEGRKRVEKVEAKTRNMDTLKYVEKKLEDKGLQRRERHPADGTSIGRGPPKGGHGGKYTWEGPEGAVESEMVAEEEPPALDEKDPNYPDGEAPPEEEEAAELVLGEVEVAKAAEEREGVARVEVAPPLNV